MNALLIRCTGVLGAALMSVCSIGAPFGSASVPSEIARLVPDGAFAMVYSGSMTSLHQSMVRTASATDPQMAMAASMMGPPMLNMLVKQDGGAMGSGGVNLDGSVAAFLGPMSKANGEPIGGLIFEVKDASNLVATQSDSHLVKLPGTNWVALSDHAYELPDTPSSLGEGMFNATLAMNIDQALAVETFKPQINAMMSMMQMPMPTGSVSDEEAAVIARSQQANIERMKTFLDMYRGWNIGIDLDGADVDVLLRMTPTEPRYLVTPSKGFARLASYLPADLTMTGAFDHSVMTMMMDMSKLDLLAMPPDARKRLEGIYGPWEQCLATNKDGMALGISFGSHGFDAVGVTDSTDVDQSIADIKKLWSAFQAADMGIEVTDLPLLASRGVGYTVKMNAEKLMESMGMAQMMSTPVAPGQPTQMQYVEEMMTRIMGPNGLHIRYLIEGDLIVNVVGNRLLGEAKMLAKGEHKANAVSDLLAHALAEPTWAMRMDVRQLADQALGFMRTALGPLGSMLPPHAPQGNPVEVSMVGSSDGTSWDQVRIRTNLKDWHTMATQFQEEAMKAMMQGQKTVDASASSGSAQ
ncbi:MAG: hypothetical protein MK100_06770 [Phycisphaerales bacterium]|nr:hypothetical protein [Phycisphaerales bacterium]